MLCVNPYSFQGSDLQQRSIDDVKNENKKVGVANLFCFSGFCHSSLGSKSTAIPDSFTQHLSTSYVSRRQNASRAAEHTPR